MDPATDRRNDRRRNEAPRGGASARAPALPRFLLVPLFLFPIGARALAADPPVSPYADSRGRFLAPPGEIPTDWVGIRAVGMGNAFTSVGNDELAPFSNPAGLARTRNPRSRAGVHEFVFPGTVLGGNVESLKAMRGGTPRQWTSRIVDSARKDPGKPRVTEVQAYPFITLGGRDSPTYLIGFPTRSTLVTRAVDVAATRGSSASQKTLLFSETTASAVLGIAGSTRASLFAWGVSLRPNIRYTMLDTDSTREHVDFASLRSDVRSKSVTTSAVAVDAGLLLTAADFWFPTLGLAVRNIPTGCVKGYVNPANGRAVTMCGTLRTKSKGTAPVDSTTGETIPVPTTQVDPTEVRAGFSITPRGRVDGNKVNLRLAVDASPLPIETGGKSYGVTDASLDSVVHAGAELFFGNALTGHGFALRAGVQDANPTYGFTASVLGVSLEFAHYVVKTGLADQRRYDKRYLLGLSTDW